MSFLSPLIVLAGLVAISDTPSVLRLETAFPVWDVAFPDLNGDGHADLAALCCDDEADPPVKEVAVFLSRAEGGYPASPTLRLPLDVQVGGAFFAKGGEGVLRLVLLTGETARILKWVSGEFLVETEVPLHTLIPTGADVAQFLPEAVQDLDGDGVDEWLLPTSLGFVLRRGNGETMDLPANTSSTMRQGPPWRITHTLPSIHVFAGAGQENQKGVAFLGSRYADFAYGAQWAERKRVVIPQGEKKTSLVSTQMHDLNGEGWPDLVINYTEGGNISVRVRTQVFLAQGPGIYPKTPTSQIDSKGAFAQPFFRDVNGDQQLDLIYIKIPYGLSFFANLFLRGKVSAHADVYLLHDGVFGAKPDLDSSITLDAPDDEMIAYTFGDFNGDGKLDLAVGTGKDSLLIHIGSKDRFLSAKPWREIPIPPFGEARTHDLDNNKSDDIILIHPDSSLANVIDVVIF